MKGQVRTHAPQRNDVYSITSSARRRIDSGTVRPIALAVLRFRTNWNLTGCCTGRSAGFAPLRMRGGPPLRPRPFPMGLSLPHRNQLLPQAEFLAAASIAASAASTVPIHRSRQALSSGYDSNRDGAQIIAKERSRLAPDTAAHVFCCCGAKAKLCQIFRPSTPKRLRYSF